MENAQAITTSEAPKAIGPYSQGALAGQFLFIAGPLPTNLTSPFPAPRAIQVSGLPLGSNIEAEAIVNIS